MKIKSIILLLPKMNLLSIDVGIKNLSYCIVNIPDINNNSFNIKAWKNISITDKKCSSMELNELTKCMIYCLKTEFDEDMLKDINNVIIENQPGLVNRTMKSLSIVIYTFFMMNDINVSFIAAVNKLKCKQCQELLKTGKYNLKKYQDRKKLGIDTIKTYIDDKFKEWENFYTLSKKKDDLSDCMLYIIYFIENKKHALKII